MIQDEGLFISEIMKLIEKNKPRPTLAAGTQIAYIPDHVLSILDDLFLNVGDSLLNKPDDCLFSLDDVEFGFVTFDRGGSSVFCRYWYTVNLNKQGKVGGNWKHLDLRTKANSEGTYLKNLVVINTVPQSCVNDFMKRYC